MGLFKFGPKFGWSEIVSCVALIFSGIAFYLSYSANSPRVLVRDFPGLGWAMHEQGQLVLMTTVPVVVFNNGGRATTLIALRPSKTFPSLIALSDDKPISGKDFKYAVYLGYGDTSSTTVETMRGWKRLDYEPVPILNLPVPSGGHSETVSVGIIAHVYDSSQRQAEYLLLGLDAEFSHGEIVPLRLALGVPGIRRGLHK